MTAERVGQGAPTGTQEYIATGGTSGTGPYRFVRPFGSSHDVLGRACHRAALGARAARRACPGSKDVASDLGIERGQDLATFEAEAWARDHVIAKIPGSSEG
jgi:hypothetical protein